MPRQSTSTPAQYLNRQAKIARIVQRSMDRHGKIGSSSWDDGTIDLLPDSADHKVLIRTGPKDIVVAILAHWRRYPILSSVGRDRGEARNSSTCHLVAIPHE